MPANLKRRDTGEDVMELQRLLTQRGYPVDIDGEFGPKTYNAVRAFQTQHLDQHGQPLVVDGAVGPLTWWALTHETPFIRTPSAIDYREMPPKELGGSKIGRAALEAAIGELNAGACEIGGNNRGKWVKKYLTPGGMPEGNPWCASFVSWCFLRAGGDDRAKLPFTYSPGARALLKLLQKKGWTHAPGSGYQPVPGDLVFWWRIRADGWQGHVGIVHQVRDGMIYTIEGNHSPKVQGFSYVLSRMEKLLGYGHIPDA
jgi:hypothetical protein